MPTAEGKMRSPTNIEAFCRRLRKEKRMLIDGEEHEIDTEHLSVRGTASLIKQFISQPPQSKTAATDDRSNLCIS